MVVEEISVCYSSLSYLYREEKIDIKGTSPFHTNSEKVHFGIYKNPISYTWYKVFVFLKQFYFNLKENSL